MSCCPHCIDSEDLFNRRTARRDLRRYRRRGPRPSTRMLVEAIDSLGSAGETLLDIGGGVGAVQHELFDRGLRAAVQVDASAAYLEASREEAERRGHAGRVGYLYGDLVQLAETLDPADIVVLDRVLCCYPDMVRLVEESTARARRVYAISYPRERRLTRLFLGLGNLFFRLRRSAFRTYLHPVAAIDAAVRRCGFRRVSLGRTFIWEVAVYAA